MRSCCPLRALLRICKPVYRNSVSDPFLLRQFDSPYPVSRTPSLRLEEPAFSTTPSSTDPSSLCKNCVQLHPLSISSVRFLQNRVLKSAPEGSQSLCTEFLRRGLSNSLRLCQPLCNPAQGISNSDCCPLRTAACRRQRGAF